MESVNTELLAQRAAILTFYSPYNFLRKIVPYERQQKLFGIGKIAHFGTESPHEAIFTHGAGQLLYSVLPWDSKFFNTPTYRLVTGLFEVKCPLTEWVKSLQSFEEGLAAKGDYYCFSEIPCEDTVLLQALTTSGWRLVETRLLYYRDDLLNYDHPRYPVRLAREEEHEHIAQISASARNEYDRFHADPWFGTLRADAFLAKYASAAVQGFCDAVLVPNEPNLPIDSFLAISDLQQDSVQLGVNLSRIVLTAVGSQNRGWHARLVSETVHRARMRGAQAVLMTTQSTNRAVFRTSEKLGFKLGGSSHVLACHSHSSAR
jgi:dTDP-4-amino-4,6-dideoxy-D-galactose acyltransferase